MTLFSLFIILIQIVFEYGIWQMIEPIMTVEVIGPSEYLGTVIAQLSKRNGFMKSSTEFEGWFTIISEVSHQINC